MNEYIFEKINEFVVLIKNEIKVKINVGYEYDDKEDIFNLWHDYVNFDEQNFKKVIGKYVRMCFFENDIFNVSISYRNDKAIEMNKIYNTLQNVETKSYNIKLSLGNITDNRKYNVKFDYKLENINNDFKMNLPKQECLLINKMNTNIGILEVPPAA